MEMGKEEKQCNKCWLVKPVVDFPFRKAPVRKHQCKACFAIYSKKYTEENREMLKVKRKGKRAIDIPRMRKWREENRGWMRRYRAENKDVIKKQETEWREENKEKVEADQKIYREQNRERRQLLKKARYKTDIEFRLSYNLCNRVRDAIKGGRKSASTMDLIGCALTEVRNHLEAQFVDGMSWENYGEWHIDHIRPCASFNLLEPEQQRECFNYKNLQPLWAFDNISKGAKLDYYHAATRG